VGGPLVAGLWVNPHAVELLVDQHPALLGAQGAAAALAEPFRPPERLRDLLT
jgi:hypothetical protein